VFGLATLNGDVDNLDSSLWKPEAFAATKSSLGLSTERDREDIEKFNLLKEKRRRESWFYKASQNFNKKMFGTPLDPPLPDDGLHESDALLKEEGIFVPQGPHGVSSLTSQGRLYSRMKRDAAQANAELEERKKYFDLAKEVDGASDLPMLSDDPKASEGAADKNKDSATFNVMHKARGPSDYGAFFTSDGNPRVGEDPVVPGSHRPDTTTDGGFKKQNAYLDVETGKVKSGVSGKSGEGEREDQQNRAELVISLPKLALYDHPDFNNEELIFSQLRLLYGKYQSHIETGVVTFLTRRLDALVAEAVALRESMGDDFDPAEGDGVLDANDDGLDDTEQLRNLYDDIMETISLRLTEEHELRQLTRDLYEKWKELKSERKEQGYTCTSARLIAREVNTDGDMDADGGTHAGNVAKGIKARLIAKKKKDAGVETRTLKDVIKDLKEVLPWISKATTVREEFREKTEFDEVNKHEIESNSPLYKDMLADLQLETRKKKDAEVAKINMLLKASEFLLPKEGKDYMLRLTNDEQYLRTEDCKSIAEKNRRKRVTDDKFYCKLVINGKTVGKTSAKALEWPSYRVNFNKRFRCRLLRRPQSISVQIYNYRGILNDKLISSSMITIPGSDSAHDGTTIHSLAPYISWYQFANSSPYDWEGEKAMRRLSGGVLVGAEWETSRNGEGENEDSSKKNEGKGSEIAPLLPDRPLDAHTGRLQGLKSSEMEQRLIDADTDHESKPADFARERDFLQMLPKLSTIDPNDPRNANLFRLKDMLLPSQKSKDVFRTLEGEIEMIFKAPGAGGTATGAAYTNIHAFEQPRRHQLLKLREAKPSLFSAAIPLNEDIIKKDEKYRNLLAAERRKHAEDEDIENDASNQRTAVDKTKIRDFVKRVRDSKQAEQRRRRKRQVHYSEVIQEGTLPDFVYYHLDFGAIADFFVPPRKRGLRPAVKSRTAVTALVRSCRLLVTIVGARNVPSRLTRGGAPPGSPKRGGSPSKGSKRRLKDEEDEGVYDDPEHVHSFVEVKFQDNTDRTRPVEGVAPLWKQTLDIPFRPPMGDFSPTQLQQVRDDVEIMLFDNINTDIGDMGGYYEDEITVQNERRFLGNLTIPFSTIYMEGKVEGTFRLNAPDVCLGYQRRSMAVVEPGSEQAYLNDAREEAEGEGDEGAKEEGGGGANKVGGPNNNQLIAQAESATYIKILATLEPLLVAPPKDQPQNVSKEDKKLVKYAIHWVERMQRASRKMKKRTFQVLAPDMHGCNWFLPRYLRPQNPPPGMDTVIKCAHFVSLVPFLEDWQAFVGDTDMWCTSQQFLDILAGDWEEHAILLMNYFQHLSDTNPADCEAELFLVIGTGIPEGDTVYVMRRDKKTGDVSLWNASSGIAYAKEDERCPMTMIGCLVTRENIYANVQKSGKPCEMSMDVNDTKCWKTFYSDVFPAPMNPLPSIQEPVLKYRPVNKLFAEELQDELTETLKRDIRRWRRGPTSFKGDASNRLKALLGDLEDVKLGVKSMTHAEHLGKLEMVTRGREMQGLPLTFAFTDISEIVSKVKATGIHSCKHPDVEFALAVRVFPYANNVMNVGVYFSALTPRIS